MNATAIFNKVSCRNMPILLQVLTFWLVSISDGYWNSGSVLYQIFCHILYMLIHKIVDVLLADKYLFWQCVSSFLTIYMNGASIRSFIILASLHISFSHSLLLPRRTLYWKAARAMCKKKTSLSYIVPVDDDVIEEARMARLQMAGEELSCRRYIHTYVYSATCTHDGVRYLLS